MLAVGLLLCIQLSTAGGMVGAAADGLVNPITAGASAGWFLGCAAYTVLSYPEEF